MKITSEYIERNTSSELSSLIVSALPHSVCPEIEIQKEEKIAGKERKEENCYELDIDHRVDTVDSCIKSSLHEYSQLQLSLWEF